MSGALQALQYGGADVINSVGDLKLGQESINSMISNISLISLFMTTLREHTVKGRPDFETEYDYIIIGGGTAGSVMASRLSQHPCVKVLLLEAGGEQPVLTEVPGFARGFLGTSVDWSYFTAPQKYSSFNQNDSKVLWNSGKVLGGSSVINAMLYVRGNKENYDQWAREGAEGWSYKDVLPYFLKLEDNKNFYEVDPGFHNREGPMTAERSNYKSKIRAAALDSLVGLGFPMTDPNGRRQFGVYDLQGTVRNQERCSTTKAYLKPARKRENLHMVVNAFVRKILISKKDGNRAFAVVVEYKNKIHMVKIRRSNCLRDGYGEIIVSNGATRTPQLLMLSGIGPKEELAKLGIPLVVDLPVGKNLMDHIAAGLLYELDPFLVNAFTKEITPDNMALWLFARQGPLCSISQVQALAFLNGLNNTNPSYDWPNHQMYYLDYNTEDIVRTLNLRPEIASKVYNPYVLRPVMLCWSQLLQPFSRGEITLSSIDPHEYPIINPNYYEDQRDVDSVVNGMKICDAVWKQPAMQKLKANWVDTQKTNYPGCEGLEGDKDKYFGCIARSAVFTIWHPTGTARMGHPKDPRSVVDPQLRVIGVRNLRVINAAVMPIIPSGNTNVPTMMVAEKGYDMMKDSILCPSTLTIRGRHQVRDYTGPYTDCSS